jgi:hypothetical protein
VNVTTESVNIQSTLGNIVEWRAQYQTSERPESVPGTEIGVRGELLEDVCEQMCLVACKP